MYKCLSFFLVLLQVDAPGEDFLGVGVSGGRVKIVWHLGGGGIGHLTPPSESPTISH